MELLGIMLLGVLILLAVKNKKLKKELRITKSDRDKQFRTLNNSLKLLEQNHAKKISSLNGKYNAMISAHRGLIDQLRNDVSTLKSFIWKKEPKPAGEQATDDNTIISGHLKTIAHVGDPHAISIGTMDKPLFTKGSMVSNVTIKIAKTKQEYNNGNFEQVNGKTIKYIETQMRDNLGCYCNVSLNNIS